MNDPRRSDLDPSGLANLPVRDAAPDVAARVRRQALARLALERRHRGNPYVSAGIALWSRVGMPLALAGVVGVYLSWAFQVAGALYR